MDRLVAPGLSVRVALTRPIALIVLPPVAKRITWTPTFKRAWWVLRAAGAAWAPVSSAPVPPPAIANAITASSDSPRLFSMSSP